MMRLKKPVQLLLMLIVLIGAVGATELRRQKRVCTQVQVVIEEAGVDAFVNEREVRGLVRQADRPITGLPLMALDLKELEQQIEMNPYIEQANAYYDLEGKVHVTVRQSHPIARLIHHKAADAYVSATGKLLPLSTQHTARVMLVSGDYIPKLLQGNWEQDSSHAQFLSLIQYIEKDDFWRAQIAQVDIDRDGEVTLYPQIGKQTIQFGQPADISKKFHKLELFYQQILPRKGWNYYDWVNVKYENQIVCD